MNDYSDYTGFTGDPEYMRLGEEISALEKQISALEREQRVIRKPYEDARTELELSEYGLKMGDRLLVTDAFKEAVYNNRHAWHVRDIVFVGDEAIVLGVGQTGMLDIEYGRDRRAMGIWPAEIVLGMRQAYLESQSS